MTEPTWKEFFVGLEGLQAGIVRRAGDIGEDVDAVHKMHDDLAEWLLSATRGIPIPDLAISAMRLRLFALEQRLLQRGLDEAAAAEGLARLLGTAKAAADTIEIDIAEIAAAKD